MITRQRHQVHRARHDHRVGVERRGRICDGAGDGLRVRHSGRAPRRHLDALAPDRHASLQQPGSTAARGWVLRWTVHPRLEAWSVIQADGCLPAHVRARQPGERARRDAGSELQDDAQ
eukprot:2858380-Rhodomonas_salina.1